MNIELFHSERIALSLRYIIGILAVSLYTMPLFSQEECSTKLSPIQIKKEEYRSPSPKKIALHSGYTLPVRLPVKVHIVRSSAGTGGISSEQEVTAFDHLNSMFEDAGMQFFKYGSTHYIDDDAYANADSATREALRQEDPVENTVNIFITTLPGDLYGESSFTTTEIQGIVLDSIMVGFPSTPSTVPHEFGHYFDLYHTHETAVGIECPDGGNCNRAGDKICDTNADPGLNDSTGYHVNSNCVYDNYAPSPADCDATPYDPPVHNLMSYSRQTCRTQMTSEQKDKVFDILTSDRDNLFERTEYIDGSTSSITENGKPNHPFNEISEGISGANTGDHLIIYGGSYNEALIISKNLVLQKWNSTGTNVVIGK